MEKEMWRLVTYEIPSSWREIIQHGEELPWAAPRNFPLCVHDGNKEKLTEGSWREAIFTARASHGHSQGQVQMQDPPLPCTVKCRPHLETEQCGRDHSWQLGLCSPSSTWPEISPRSWAAEEIWGETEAPGSVMRACYSCNPRAQREIDFLRNWFTKVLN